MKLPRILLLPIAVAGCALNMPALATPALYTSTNGTTWNIFGTTFGTGTVSGSNTLGGNFYLASGTSNPTNGTSSFPGLSLNVSGTFTGGSLYFALTDDNFVSTLPQLATLKFNNLGSGYTVTSSFYSALFNQGTGLASVTGSPCGSSVSLNAFGSSSSGCTVSGSSPFALTSILFFSSSGPVSMGTNNSISVPEPSTLALLGIGLLGFGLARRRLAA